MTQLPDSEQAGALSQAKIELSAHGDAIAEVVGEWLTDNRAELDDGGSGDVIALALQIAPFVRIP